MTISSHVPHRLRRPATRDGFTLAEMLVSMAMLTLLILVVVAITNSAATAIKLDRKKLDIDAQARAIFDRMQADFSSMIQRADVDYVFNNLSGQINSSANLFFYSEAPGISSLSDAGSTTDSPLNSPCSLVGYRVNASSTNGEFQLMRLGKGLQWLPSAAGGDGFVHLTYASFPVTVSSNPIGGTLGSTFPLELSQTETVSSADDNYHVIGAGVFRITFWFLLKPYQASDGSYQPGIVSYLPYDVRRRTPPPTTGLTSIGMQDVQAIVVSMVMLDEETRKLLPANTNWTQLAQAFPDPKADATNFVPPNWEEIANSAGGNSLASITGLSKAVAEQVRVYQRTFNLTTPSNQ